MKGTVLVVDDEEQLRKLLLRILALEGYTMLEAATLKQAEDLLQKHNVDLLLCDVKLPDGNGVVQVKRFKQLMPLAEIILLTAFGNISDGVSAIKNGAFDYLTKGNDNDRIIPLVAQGIQKAQSQKMVAVSTIPATSAAAKPVSKDPAMQQIIRLADKIAASHSAVLLTGETGTGKEVMAKYIHARSQQSKADFLAINCSAFPRDLLESELFGHKAGAFTGATKDKKGLVEMADGGSLFLDEIGEMQLDLQAKMLRFLESGEFFKVGDSKLSRVSVRVIAATNRNLEDEIKEGRFRKDLYYRLNTFTLYLPPLRERVADIPLLAQDFISRFAAQEKKKPPVLSDKAMSAILQYPWNGNIRELRNLMERAVVLSDNAVIDLDDLPPHLRNPSVQQNTTSLAEMEKQHIRKILERTGQNKTKAANLLGIGLATLYRKLEEYGIPK
ncbi:MAG: sigma-54 dependent transcriptional regulator [Chitinophagaceae bacterium]